MELSKSCGAASYTGTSRRGGVAACPAKGPLGAGVERCAPATAPHLGGARPIRLLTLKARFV
ncbi:hypothetical protein [Sorangium sp. So ce542]|uniref:hypothetical protein n=1 Tax=Sorangium sp. So ce542 TaxID=3133316 RepID=UPI003F621666